MRKIAFILFLLLFLPLSFYSQTTVTLTSPGTSTFIVPAGVNSLTVECWGAGGAGGGTAGNATAAGGGGGGGGYSINTIAVLSGSSISYTVGAGGNGATTNGANGGSTSFSTVSASGGLGGLQGNSNIGAGGAGGTGTTFNGGKGANGILSTSGGGGGGSAGSTSNGNIATNGTGATAVTNGGAGGDGGVGFVFIIINVGNNGSSGTNPGGGGGGGDNGDFGFVGFYYSGGDGGDGQIKITYNCAAYNLTSTVAASVNVCAGNSSIITLNSTVSGLPIGLYTVAYEIQGVPQTPAVMNVTTAGTGTFIASGFTTIGTRTVKITRITSQSCYTDIIANNLTTVTVNSTLSAPTALSGSGATCTQITANWNAISGATYYELDVATDSGFTTFVPGYNALNVGNVVTRNITGLTSGVTYYYRVRAFNGTCISSNSATITYATTVAPGTPTLNAVTGNTCTQFTINWSAGTGTTNSYTIEWSTSASNFATLLGSASGITALSYTITGLTNGTQYKYRIRAVNGCGSSANVTSGNVTTSGSSPGTPTLNAVTGNTCSQFTVNWSAGTGTTNSYTIQWSTSAANFSPILGSATGITASTYTITGLTNSTLYKYRIIAVNGCGSSSAVTSGNVTTSGSAPGTPTLNAVSGITCTQFNVNWSAGTGTTNSYIVEWSTSAANFSPILGSATGITLLTYTITGLTNGTQYKYRIRAVNGCNSSANVTSGNITTSSIPSAPTISTLDAIPFCQTDGATLTSSSGSSYLWSTGETTQSIFVTTAGSYTVQITNASGCQSPNSAATVVTVQGLPTAAAGGNKVICSNSTATVSGASANNGTILWTHNGTGTLSNVTTLTPTYTPAIGDIGNTITLTMTVTSNNTCAPQIATSTYAIVVNETPIQPTLGAVTQPTCSIATGNFSISNYNSTYTYTVTPSTGVTVSSSSITAPAGTYTVTSTRGSCTSIASASVTVNIQPTTPVQPTLGSVTQPTCSLSTGSFSITNYNASYIYATTPSVGVTISGSSITAPAGTYTVTATLGSCNSIASASATVNAQPITPVQPTLGSVTQPTCSLATGSFSITNYNATYTYAASPSIGITFSGATVSAPSGTYTVTATLGSCTSTTSTSVTLNAQPINTWSVSGWSAGSPPTSAEKIVFASNFNSSSDLTGCSCEVNSGANVHIDSGHTLTLVNSLTVNPGGTLNFDDDASLVQTNDTAVNSGNIVYERETTPLKRYDYTYWSSPVAGAALSQLASNSLFYSFNPIINNWVYQTSSVPMTAGVGYISRAPNNLTYAPTEIVETSFVGTPNNGVINAPILKSTGAFNLIGNPYPSAIDIDLFLTNATNLGVVNGTVFLWTHSTAITNNVYTANDYAKYNFTGSTRTSTPAYIGGVSPSGKIAAGQGFFIEAKTSLSNGTYSAIFNNSMRIAGNNTQFFKTTVSTNSTSISESLERSRVWLSLNNDQGLYNQMLVGYVEGATNDFDSLFDGKTLPVGNPVSIYTSVGNDNLSIQGRSLPFSADDIVPVSYSTTITCELRISLDDFDGLFDNTDIYLLDKYSGIFHDLKANDFLFTTTAGTFTDRFELRFVTQSLGNVSPSILDQDIKVFTNDNHLSVLCASAAITKIQVYDIFGKLLFNQNNLNTHEFKTNMLNIAPQMILVKIALDNEQISTKKTLIH